MNEMPRKRRFEVKITVNIPRKLADFLDELVEAGVVENLSQAVRRCIAIAREYVPELKIEGRGLKDEEKEE